MTKVAVICLCYNHTSYVAEALQSVLNQTYHDWELIIVDDASVDDSVEKIQEFVEANNSFSIQTVFSSTNDGNCKSFNKALAHTNADYIIDLAADDILLPDRLASAVESMEVNDNIALNFSNAHYISETGKVLYPHYPVNSSGNSKVEVPQGDVFTEIIKRYFICSPTMVYRASYLKQLGGYDENLAYEDFDIKIRMARDYPFSYTDKILVSKRIVKTSMSENQYKRNNRQLDSTLQICFKIYLLLQNKNERNALLRRVAFEGRQSFFNGRMLLFLKFSSLWVKTIFRNV